MSSSRTSVAPQRWRHGVRTRRRVREARVGCSGPCAWDEREVGREDVVVGALRVLRRDAKATVVLVEVTDLGPPLVILHERAVVGAARTRVDARALPSPISGSQSANGA